MNTKVIPKVSPDIFVIDDLKPEDGAMAQGLYSRDPKSIIDHLKKVAEVGSGKFMDLFYVGYGHKSIGDCGTTTIYIEQVSMLCAKAIQDWFSYNGQEASTRYLDMRKQAVLNPAGNSQGEEIQQRWMAFYEKVLDALILHLPSRFPMEDGEDEKKYRKAIKAKAFDVARGFLPAGVTTLVSWHTNLRQAADHLKEMRHHPLTEIREVAGVVHESLMKKYSNSFSHKKHEKDEEYLSRVTPLVTYIDDPKIKGFKGGEHLFPYLIDKFRKVLETRPEKSELPKQMRICGNFGFEFLIDFGSFRDFQRQRSVMQTMPLLTTSRGFHPWYLAQLPEELRVEAFAFLQEQEEQIAFLEINEWDRQYYIGMGYQVAVSVLASVPAAVYIAELRSQQSVHPTLRVIAKQMGRYIQDQISNIAIHCDWDDDVWSTKRADQDIVRKEDVKG